MNITKANNLACPIDGARLEFHEKQLDCKHGHVFDIARQGYVNLLLVQHKRSKYPGDSKEMVLARAAFLNSGIYQPVANKLAETVFAHIVHTKAACFMDAGCGEGYYTNYIFNYLKNNGSCSNLSFIGLDISKPAIVEAAKRNKQITWVVGTNRHPPVGSASVDIISCVFGFRSFEGFNKILKPGGKLILVEPGPDHLKELREIIYAEVRKTEPQDYSGGEETGFSMVANEQLQVRAEILDNEQIDNLLLMTPHFYRASKEGREAAGNLGKLELTVDIIFRTLEKRR